MRWQIKAVVQRAISLLPNPEGINYLLQSHVTKKFPLPKEQFLWRVDHAIEHFKAIRSHFPGGTNLRGYEFGAGWDMIVPLTLCALGIERQSLVDIRYNLRPELVQDTIHRLNQYRAEIEQKHGVTMRELKPLHCENQVCVQRELYHMGISYKAPCDASKTGLPADSVDFITSTYTLEHIPRASIVAILRECRRILHPDGVMSSLIDMQDHYSGFDHNCSVYNYLKFPGWLWGLVNCDLQYQNRLRYSDYIALAQDARFLPLETFTYDPTREDLNKLRALTLAPEFKRYPESDLAVKRLRMVMV